MSEYLTTKELAELLRIKERKVYDLAASGEIPCSRAMGKLLFPRAAVEVWLARASSGLDRAGEVHSRPNVFLGSHDPLLDWALRESGCGLATYFDGSLDGLERFAAGEGIASGLHIYEPAAKQWNTPAVVDLFAAAPVVLVEWAWRERGLIVAPDSKRQFKKMADLAGARIVPRQAEAGAQKLLTHLLQLEGPAADSLTFTPPVRTESDAALAVLEGKADAAFGLKSLASQYRLGFSPIIKERFDLLIDRRSWFEPPMRTFLEFCGSKTFGAKLSEIDGYDVGGFGAVHFNGR